MEPPVVVIHNPISGRKSRTRLLDGVVARIENSGRRVERLATRGPGDGAVRAREAADAGASLVVAAGGDGTVNDVAAGVLASARPDTPIGILPFGTSNLVARELGIPLRIDGATATLIDGAERTLDVGRVADADGERLFLACIGVGWDAHVVETLSARRTGHIRFTSYVGPTWRATFDYGFPPLRLETAEGEEAEGEIVIVLNCRPYAAFFTPVPDASASDGELDALVLQRRSVLDVPRWIVKARRGTLAADGAARVFRSTGFRITSDEAVPYQVDGDAGGRTPLDTELLPGVLRIRAPR